MNDPEYVFISELKKLDGAIPYDGDASVQVVFKLANGKNLRIGITDSDVADKPGLWCDQYEGLPIKGGDPQLSLPPKAAWPFPTRILTPESCKAGGCDACDGSCMHD